MTSTATRRASRLNPRQRISATAMPAAPRYQHRRTAMTTPATPRSSVTHPLTATSQPTSMVAQWISTTSSLLRLRTSTRSLSVTTIPSRRQTTPPAPTPATTFPPTSRPQTTQLRRPARYNKSLALGFAGATIVATLVIAGALMAMRSGTPTAAQDPTGRPSTQVSVVAAPSTTAPAAANSDTTIPYTATAVGCLPGSTASQSVAGPDSTQAWVCVHGGNIGQYLVLNLGRTMVITAVSITPGWVGADASGADQWQQHRVVTRVQWSFNDSPPTVVPQETGSVHGDAVKPMPDRGVLASRIIMLVQETGRAPADTAPTSSPGPAPGGLLDGVLGPPPGTDQPTPAPTTAVLPGLPDDQSRTDPADNTFAVSSIKIFGHPPQ